MKIQSMQTYFVNFDQSIRSTFKPLPQDGKMWEVAKRVAMVAVAPFVYIAKAIVSAVEFILPKGKVEKQSDNDTQPIPPPQTTSDDIPPPPQTTSDDIPPPPQTTPIPPLPSTSGSVLDEVNSYYRRKPVGIETIKTLETVNFYKQRINYMVSVCLENKNFVTKDFVALDILFRVKIDKEIERFGSLHIKKSPSITNDFFQRQIDSLFRGLQNSYNADHRSKEIKAAWFVAGRDNLGNFARFYRDLDDRRIGGFKGDWSEADALQRFPLEAAQRGFEAEDLWSLNRRNNTNDYEHFEAL